MPRSIAVLLALLLGATSVDTMAQRRKPPLPPPSFDVVEADVASLQEAMTKGRISARRLVETYLARIRDIDKGGPQLNSVIEVNPDALAIADALDRERKAGKLRGPLHGIPVLLKDNIASGDKMETTAGSLALAGVKAPRDAHLVMRLREAGAVILGKANLSEWANIRSTRSTSGWSARGGLTRNPYALDRNSSGSSSGSAVAVAANLAAVAVGTETDGSIVSPASANGIVGIKPTVGLVSRAGIIPISRSQDTAGPMARTVADAAALLAAMAGTDLADAVTADASARKADYAKALDRTALKGARIGVVRSQFTQPRNDLVAAEIEKALAVLKAQGAVLVEVPEIPNAGKYSAQELEVLLTELKAGLAEYLAEYAPGAPVKTLADVVAFNEKNAGKEMPYFAQEHFVAAVAKGGLDAKEYVEALTASRRMAREGIDRMLQEHKLDALVAPTGQPAWLTDFIKGDASGGAFTQGAAVAGYPHVTVPAGFVHGLPVGVSFVGTAWTEARLIALAYAYEQASRARRPPAYSRTANTW